jgi:hypothetical protein
VKRLVRCDWCLRRNAIASDWEQQSLRGKLWKPLCRRCANKRFRNPWNALLPMRKIDTANAPHQARRDSGVALNAVVGSSESKGETR